LAARATPARGAESGLGEAVAVIPVKGVITSGSASAGFSTSGTAYSERVIDDLKKAEADPTVRAIVLDVDSPGGSVVASADIHRALRECPKPVVTSMGETAASGGYYIACATQYILARPSTLTGSIGVIWEFTNAATLLEKLGVQVQVIKSGSHKDEGGLYRALTADEVAVFQALVNESYEEFLQVVADGRKLPVDQVRALADGRVYSGHQALGLKLIDAEGNLDDAIQVAARRGGIRGEPRIVRYEASPSFWQILSGFTAPAQRPAELQLLEAFLGKDGAPKLEYRYLGP
jgi:protease IV